VIKVGQMASAFGSFPLRYDDRDNPLIDHPLSYTTQLPIRGDQLICNTGELLQQSYGSVAGGCGGVPGRGPGLIPVTLYGLPGFEVEAAAKHYDLRTQITMRSPSTSSHWTTRFSNLTSTLGAGFKFRPGLRIGVSGFRGPYLDQSVASALPSGADIRGYTAHGVGVDGQWAQGRFSARAEWQHFQFGAPNFATPPSASFGYGELKTVLTPRFYVAARGGALSTGSVTDAYGATAGSFAPSLTSLELGGGVWLSRQMLFKASYGWLHTDGQTNNRNNVFGVQLVATIPSLNWAFR